MNCETITAGSGRTGPRTALTEQRQAAKAACKQQKLRSEPEAPSQRPESVRVRGGGGNRAANRPGRTQGPGGGKTGNQAANRPGQKTRVQGGKLTGTEQTGGE